MTKKIFIYNFPDCWIASAKPIPKRDFEDPFGDDLEAEEKQYSRRPNFIKKLALNILQNGGDNVLFQCYQEELWKLMYKSGRLFNNLKKSVWRMEVHNCHKNCLDKWSKYPGRYQVVTGFTLGRQGGGWNEHTWLINPKKKTIVDPLRRFEKYYGIILSEEYLQRWYYIEFPERKPKAK